MQSITEKLRNLNYSKTENGALGILGMILGEMQEEDVKIQEIRIISATQAEELSSVSQKLNVLIFGNETKLIKCYVLVLIVLTQRDHILMKIADSSSFKKILNKDGRTK